MNPTRYCRQCRSMAHFVQERCSNCDTPYSSENPYSYFFREQPSPANISVHFQPEDCLERRFVIQKSISLPGLTHLYQAEDTLWSEPVILKILDFGPQNADRVMRQFRSEFGWLSKLEDYRHVMQVNSIHFSQWEGRELLIFSMEFTEEMTLRQWLNEPQNRGEQRCSEKAEYFKQICRGADILQKTIGAQWGIAPEIFQFVGTRLKAHYVSIDEIEHDLAANPDCVFLPYLCPEYLTSGDPNRLTPAAQVYALGAVWYEMNHPQARPPFTGSRGKMRQKFRQNLTPELLPIEESEWKMICRCLEKNPEKRYPDESALLEVLAREQRPIEITATPPSEPGAEVPEAETETIWNQAESAYTQGNLQKALTLCTEILERGSNHVPAKQRQQELKTRYQQAEQLYQFVQQEMGRKGLEELITIIKEAIELFPDHPVGLPIQVQLGIQCEQFKKSLQEGKKALNSECWDTAYEQFKQAMALNPSAPNLPRLLEFLTFFIHTRNKFLEQIDAAKRERNPNQVRILTKTLHQHMNQARQYVAEIRDELE